MSVCYMEDYVMLAADMGKENPLPDIKNISYIHAKIETTENIPEDRKTYINKGMIQTMLPYLQQDGYDRNRKLRKFRSVVLENGYLKAIFLPELGGRLWSLVDKTQNRELLYCNPVFQPCNLALRNAWFSGGVEFNVSIKGHNPLTCESMFTQKLLMSDGSEGVRMFAYERIRGVAYSIDAWIPKDGKMLCVRPTIENRTGKEIWMYWWSNIAVPQRPGIRVLAPTKKTFVNYFGNDHYVLDYADCPHTLGTDISYPENIKRSIDFFYDIADDEKKWIACVDANGYGLLHRSTPELKGRKVFLWGEGNGGKNWNHYLSDGTNSGYIEIQAGLARTQLEHIPMPDHGVWQWTETYGAVDVGADAHADWQLAVSAVESCFGQDPDTISHDGQATGELLHFGSGWGALEEYRRQVTGQSGLSDRFTFPERALTDAQREWINLHETGILQPPDPQEEPKGYVVDPFWRGLLTESLQKEENRNWYSLMHLGVMEYAAGHREKACELFLESVEKTPNAWSYRNLAMLYRNEYAQVDTACGYMEKAFSINKTCRGILVDLATTYLMAERYAQWLAAYEQIGSWQKDGRLKLYCAKALMGLERYEEATAFLNKDLLMPDIKEGDTAISDVWFTLYGTLISQKTGITDPQRLQQLVEEQYPLGKLDFRTH